jgi:ABC-type branched-subunit amino acid transport system ATPase component
MHYQPTSNSSQPREPNTPSPRQGPLSETSLIEARGVSKNYGAFPALQDVSIAVRAGEFVSIVGPNGAGKTTLVNLLTGLLVPTKGEIYFQGRNIAGIGPVALATQGVARTFQLVQIFPELTVAETIAAAVVTRKGKRWRLLSPLLQDAEIANRIAEIAAMFGLSSRHATLSRLRTGARSQAAAAGRADRRPLACRGTLDRGWHRLHLPARPRRADR